jgi:Outer membrane protein beta-barrel domain
MKKMKQRKFLLMIFHKPLLFVVLILFGVAPSHAVDFYAGVKGGLGLAGFWGAAARDSATMTGSLRAGFCGGAVGAALFTGNVGVQAEVLYAQKGKTESGDYSTLAVQEEWKADYLEVPVLCRLSFPLKASRILVYAGPSFSYLLSSSYTLTTQTDVLDKKTTVIDRKDSTNSFDAGPAAGGGMEFDIPAGEIIFDLRFTGGLIAADRQLDRKNYLITFMIGYAFKF